MTTIILISFSIFSGLGIAIIIIRHFKEARMKTEREVSIKDIFLSFAKSINYFWRYNFLFYFYRCLERIIFNLGRVLQKTEEFLLNLDNYIRGKYRVKMNNSKNNSKYWRDIIGFKNDLNNNKPS
jgi:hypothetical protein